MNKRIFKRILFSIYILIFIFFNFSCQKKKPNEQTNTKTNTLDLISNSSSSIKIKNDVVTYTKITENGYIKKERIISAKLKQSNIHPNIYILEYPTGTVKSTFLNYEKTENYIDTYDFNSYFLMYYVIDQYAIIENEVFYQEGFKGAVVSKYLVDNFTDLGYDIIFSKEISKEEINKNLYKITPDGRLSSTNISNYYVTSDNTLKIECDNKEYDITYKTLDSSSSLKSYIENNTLDYTLYSDASLEFINASSSIDDFISGVKFTINVENKSVRIPNKDIIVENFFETNIPNQTRVVKIKTIYNSTEYSCYRCVHTYDDTTKSDAFKLRLEVYRNNYEDKFVYFIKQNEILDATIFVTLNDGSTFEDAFFPNDFDTRQKGEKLINTTYLNKEIKRVFYVFEEGDVPISYLGLGIRGASKSDGTLIKENLNIYINDFVGNRENVGYDNIELLYNREDVLNDLDIIPLTIIYHTVLNNQSIRFVEHTTLTKMFY